MGGTELPEIRGSRGLLLGSLPPHTPSALCPSPHVCALESCLSHLISLHADFPSTPSHPPFSFSAFPISLFPHLLFPAQRLRLMIFFSPLFGRLELLACTPPAEKACKQVQMRLQITSVCVQRNNSGFRKGGGQALLQL